MKAPARLEDHIGYWLRSLSNQVSASFALRLSKHDVSVPQWVVLRVLHGSGAISLKELATRLGLDQGALSRMVERLLARGLVTRSTSAHSRREIAIALSDVGRQLVPRLAREADENDRHFFRTLTAAQRKTFLATIKTLLAANAPDSPMPLD